MTLLSASGGRYSDIEEPLLPGHLDDGAKGTHGKGAATRAGMKIAGILDSGARCSRNRQTKCALRQARVTSSSAR